MPTYFSAVYVTVLQRQPGVGLQQVLISCGIFQVRQPIVFSLLLDSTNNSSRNRRVAYAGTRGMSIVPPKVNVNLVISFSILLRTNPRCGTDTFQCVVTENCALGEFNTAFPVGETRTKKTYPFPVSSYQLERVFFIFIPRLSEYPAQRRAQSDWTAGTKFTPSGYFFENVFVLLAP